MTIGICAGTAGMGRLFGRLAAMLFLTFGLSACAIPPAVSLISVAADGVLLAATGKSKTDHGLSIATGKDCSTFRALEGEDVCQDIAIAQTEPMPAAISRELDALRVAAPRDQDFAAADAAMTAAFRAPPPPPLVLAAAPRPAPVAMAGAPAALQLAALAATAGPVAKNSVAAAKNATDVAQGRGGKRLAAVKTKRLAAVKTKRLAAVKAKRMAALKARQQRLGALTRPADPAAATPAAAPPLAAPATVSRGMPATGGDQLALAP